MINNIDEEPEILHEVITNPHFFEISKSKK